MFMVIDPISATAALTALAGTAGVGAGLWNLFGKKKKETQISQPQQLETKWQEQLRNKIEQYIYGGTPYYQRAGGLLEEYLGSEMPPLWGTAATELERTLGSYYEPYIGKAYEPYRREAERIRETESERLGRKAQMAGMYESTPYLGIEAELGARTSDILMSKLASLYEAERGRKLAAISPAAEMARYEETRPLAKAEAAMAYEERPLSWAMNLLTGYTPTAAYPTYQTEPGLGEIGMDLLTAYLMGGGGFDFGKGGTSDAYTSLYGTLGEPEIQALGKEDSIKQALRTATILGAM